MNWWLDRFDDTTVQKELEIWVRKYQDGQTEKLVRDNNGQWALLRPITEGSFDTRMYVNTKDELDYVLPAKEIKELENARFFEISRSVNIAFADIYKRNLKNAQYLVCEGQKAIEWADSECPHGTYGNRLYVVKCPNTYGTIYKDCISIVMRGDFSVLEYEKPKETDVLQIPRMKKVETKERQPDVVREIFL